MPLVFKAGLLMLDMIAQWVIDYSKLVEGVVNFEGFDHDLLDSLINGGLLSIENSECPDLCFFS